MIEMDVPVVHSEECFISQARHLLPYSGANSTKMKHEEKFSKTKK